MYCINSQGNWWQLSKHRQEGCLDYDGFMNAVRNQTEKKISRNNKDNMIFDNRYFIENLHPILESHQFEQLVQTYQELDKEYYPLLTFHATSDINKINSITKYGYLMPGDVHPESGYSVMMQNGKYYGNGIYSSTEFHTNEWYTFLDKKHAVQVIVNIVLPGKVHTITAADYSKKEWCYPQSVSDDKYRDGSHSRTPDFRLWVSASSKYIVPVLLLTLRPNCNSAYMKIYLQPTRNGTLFDFDLNWTQKLKPYNFINAYKLFDDYYLLDITNPLRIEQNPVPEPEEKLNVDPKKKKVSLSEKLLEKKCDIKKDHHVLIPVHKHFAPYKQKFEKFIGAIHGHGQDCHLYLYSGNVKLVKLGAGQFSSYIDSYTSTPGNCPIEALEMFFESLSSNDNNANIIYLFVHKSVDHVVNRCNNLVHKYYRKNNHLNIIVKLIYMSDNINSETIGALNHIKYYLSTRQLAEEYAQYVSKDQSLETCMENIEYENSRSELLVNTTSFTIPYPQGIIGEGFIRNLYRQPFWDLTTSEPVLYKGSNIHVIKVDGEFVGVKWHNETSRDQSLVFTECIMQKLYSFRNYAMIHPERIKMFEPIIGSLCEKLLAHLSNLETVSLVKTYSYALTSIFNEMKTFAKVEFKGKWFDQLARLTFAKSIIRRSKLSSHYSVEQVLELIPKLPRNSCQKIKEASDALSHYSDTGYGVRVRRSNASEIEPWLIIIDYISREKFDVSTLYKGAELRTNVPITDSAGQVVTDAITISSFSLNLLDMMYTSYIFTRNPYLYIPGQRIALITNCWVWLLGQIFTTRSAKYWTLMTLYYDNVKRMFEQTESSTQIISNILTHCDFECYLTEASDISSICKILGMMTTSCADALYLAENTSKYHRLCFALLAESIMRACRAYMKSKNSSSEDIIRRILGLESLTNLEEWKFDLMRSSARTAKFYKGKWTNCTPYETVATLEYLEISRKKSSDQICRDFLSESMGKFLNKHLPEQDKYAVQLALFLQGVKFHKANMRQHIHFDNAESIIQSIVKEQIDTIRKEQQFKQRMYDIRVEKMKELQIWHIYHAGLPKIFTRSEINDLNKTRPIDDQLEVLPNSLLKHHCGYTTCPYYLVNMQTDQDKKFNSTKKPGAKDRRNGIRKHLSVDILIGNYVKGLHKTAQNIGHNIESKFKDKMKSVFGTYESYNDIPDDMIGQLWQFYH